MAQLGTPDEYDAWIVDSATEDPIYRVPWSLIKWQRTENNVSVGSVTVAEADKGPSCCGLLEVLFPWSRSLRIDRQGATVWDGPITGWGRPSVAAGGPRGVTVRAHDRSALTWKRLVAETENLSGDPTAILVELLTDALFGTGADPYQFNIPVAVDIVNDVLREYRADRIERVFDAISDLITTADLWYTQRVADMLVDRPVVRDQLGLAGDRPKLNENTTVDLPGFDVDGLGMTTENYVGGAAMGPGGFPRIGVSNLWAGQYLASTLQGGRGNSRSTRQYDLNMEAQFDATRTATPAFTIEQVPLTASFGSRHMLADLSNLLPGCLVDIDYEDTCAFDVPYLGLDLVNRPRPVPVIPQPYGIQPTPVRSASIVAARVAQLDVSVSAEGGVREEMLLSATPHADWDGTMPEIWLNADNDALEP